MNRRLLTALAIPILILLVLTFVKKNIYVNGREFTLDIEGYDPRDLLSGHYLIYRVNYGIENICTDSKGNHEASGFVCLEPRKFSAYKPIDCKAYLSGQCSGNRFSAGIERFYIPENLAKELEKKVRDKRSQIVIGVLPDGSAVVKNLLIDGKSWKE